MFKQLLSFLTNPGPQIISLFGCSVKELILLPRFLQMKFNKPYMALRDRDDAAEESKDGRQGLNGDHISVFNQISIKLSWCPESASLQIRKVTGGSFMEELKGAGLLISLFAEEDSRF